VRAVAISAGDSRRRRAVATLVLLLALVASAWRFYRVRNFFEFVDESVETTTGWLVSRGDTLYGSVFSHHMPLAVMVSHAIAVVSPNVRPAHFRVAPWAAYALLSLAIAFGPSGRRRPVAGRLAGASFLVIASALAPVIWGHFVLDDVFWGIAFAAFFVLLPLPLSLGEEPTTFDALCAGAAAALALAGSPLAAFPVALGFVLSVVASRKGRRSSLGAAFVVGLATVGLVLGAWLVRFADLHGFLEEVFRFNSNVYARFLGPLRGPASLVPETFRDWHRYLALAVPQALERRIDALLLPFVVVTTTLLTAAAYEFGRRRSGRGRAFGLALLVVLTVLFLRMRGGDFRSVPLYVTAAAAAVLVPWAAGPRVSKIAIALLAAAILPAAIKVVRHESFFFGEKDRVFAEGAWWHVARYVEAHTDPGERIAAFPTAPIVYLEARRRPATDSVFFLPWQSAWEAEHPERPSTCEQLKARRPRFVAIQEAVIWGYFPWKDYAACIHRFLESDYEPVDRPELGGLLLRRKEVGLAASPP